jgi:hypothetical protein
LHVNVAYGLVPEAWVVEGAGAEALDIAVVAEAAAAAQDIGGAQAMAEGNDSKPTSRIHSEHQYSIAFNKGSSGGKCHL